MKVINFEIDGNVLRIRFEVNKFEFEMFLGHFVEFKDKISPYAIVYTEDNTLKVFLPNLELIFIKR